MSDEQVKEESGPGMDLDAAPEEVGADLMDGGGVPLGELSFTDLEPIFPQHTSLSIAHQGPDRWAAILRPLPKEAPALLLPGHVSQSQTPIICAGPTLAGAITGAFAMLAPEGLRCPQCGEFSLEKLADVPGSDKWVQCLTCGKKYAGAH